MKLNFALKLLFEYSIARSIIRLLLLWFFFSLKPKLVNCHEYSIRMMVYLTATFFTWNIIYICFIRFFFTRFVSHFTEFSDHNLVNWFSGLRFRNFFQYVEKKNHKNIQICGAYVQKFHSWSPFFNFSSFFFIKLKKFHVFL